MDTAAPGGGTGDVKYHYGASGRSTGSGRSVTVTLPEPGRLLEYVNPVIEGLARSRPGEPQGARPATVRASTRADPRNRATRRGVVAGTLSLQALPGYSTGGRIRLIAVVSASTRRTQEEGRSRLRLDLREGLRSPHWPPSAAKGAITARLAVAFRQTFGRDALIDLIGYRAWQAQRDRRAVHVPDARSSAAGAQARRAYSGRFGARRGEPTTPRRTSRVGGVHRELKLSMGGPLGRARSSSTRDDERERAPARNCCALLRADAAGAGRFRCAPASCARSSIRACGLRGRTRPSTTRRSHSPRCCMLAMPVLTGEGLQARARSASDTRCYPDSETRAGATPAAACATRATPSSTAAPLSERR